MRICASCRLSSTSTESVEKRATELPGRGASLAWGSPVAGVKILRKADVNHLMFKYHRTLLCSLSLKTSACREYPWARRSFGHTGNSSVFYTLFTFHSHCLLCKHYSTASLNIGIIQKCSVKKKARPFFSSAL